ncbi:recombinase RecT [Nonomuraea sp. MTCD27]|uniref:recombinase RecT n=1 Tax=Nonomuraea sp. MTCD27 TaxID=1676747 RepID=UPI0035C02DBD
MTLATLPAERVVDSLPERQEYAKALSVSNLLPKQYQGQPGNVLYAVEFGQSLGISTMAAILGVHIIEGRASASSGLISALVRRAGHRLRVWVERDSAGSLVAAVATIVRKDDPDFEFRATWTMGRAQAAGLAGKQVWKNYPEAMLKARAISEVAREACEEELSGVGYTPEELGAEVNGDGSIVVTTARPNTPGRSIREAVAPQQQQPEAPVEPVTGHVAERMISDAQLKKMGTALREAGLTDRDSALAFVNAVLERDTDNPVTSRNELTLDEASRVIDALDQEAAAKVNQPADGDTGEQGEAA